MIIFFAFIGALAVGVIGYRAATGYHTDLPKQPSATEMQTPAAQDTSQATPLQTFGEALN